MTEGAHLTDSDLAGFVDNLLGPDSRRLVMAHLESCTECRSELVAITSLVEKAPASPRHRSVVSALPRGRKRGFAGAGALAAGLAGILLLRGPLGPGKATETVRAPVAGSTEAPRIAAVAPRDGASLQNPREGVFTWHAYDSDNYRFVLLEEDGTPLWSLDTHDTSLVLPAGVSLRPGGTYFWRVDAHADGITASSGTMRLQVPR